MVVEVEGVAALCRESGQGVARVDEDRYILAIDQLLW